MIRKLLKSQGLKTYSLLTNYTSFETLKWSMDAPGFTSAINLHSCFFSTSTDKTLYSKSNFWHQIITNTQTFHTCCNMCIIPPWLIGDILEGSKNEIWDIWLDQDYSRHADITVILYEHQNILNQWKLNCLLNSCSSWHQRKYQSSILLALCEGNPLVTMSISSFHHVKNMWKHQNYHLVVLMFSHVFHIARAFT